MQRNLFVVGAAVIVGALALTVVPGSSQGQTGGRAAIPRTPDGHPNLEGVWQALNSAVWDIQDHSASLGVPAGQGIVEGNEIPYTPAALRQRQENYTNRLTGDPESKCWMVGVPRLMYMPYPFQIFQTPKEIVLISEYVHTVRNMRFGTQHPEGEVGDIQWYMGDSRPRWDGDTLVVDVVHFTPDTWFDRSGNFHSEALHVVERYTMTSPDHMLYEATIEDPKTFTRPWKISMPLYRRQEKNIQLLEYECQAYLEAERDTQRGR
jgi:hypothetical protein